MRGYLPRRGHVWLQPVRLDVEQLDVRGRGDEALDRVEHLLQMRSRSVHQCHADRGALPRVLVIDFGDRDLEPVPEPVDDRADRGALRLQRPTLGDMELETHRGRVHDNGPLAPAGVHYTRAISRSS